MESLIADLEKLMGDSGDENDIDFVIEGAMMAPHGNRCYLPVEHSLSCPIPISSDPMSIKASARSLIKHRTLPPAPGWSRRWDGLDDCDARAVIPQERRSRKRPQTSNCQPALLCRVATPLPTLCEVSRSLAGGRAIPACNNFE